MRQATEYSTDPKTNTSADDRRQNRPIRKDRAMELLVEAENILRGHQTVVRIRETDSPETLNKLLTEARSRIERQLQKDGIFKGESIKLKRLANLQFETGLQKIYKELHPPKPVTEKLKEDLRQLIGKIFG